MDWQPRAQRLAETTCGPHSRWHEPLCTTPRHRFVPRWWTHDGDGRWRLERGPDDEAAWLDAAYADTSLVTSVGGRHADEAAPGDVADGRPTSSSTMPSLLVRTYRHARLYEGAHVLDVGTGSGYGTALLSRRLGEHSVTAMDVDGYLNMAAAERLHELGLHPAFMTGDALGPLPGSYDRIVATVSVPGIPGSWLGALTRGGRLITTLAHTGLIVTANKTDDGGAEGQVEWDQGAFMVARSGSDYPPGLREKFEKIRDADGDDVGPGTYPVVNVPEAWEVWSMLELTVPGIEHYFEHGPGGRRTAWMVHADGSWARASAEGRGTPEVHQSGPRRLWDELDRIRTRWLAEGRLPVHGAVVRIEPDGTCRISRGSWEAIVAAPGTPGSRPV